MYDQETYGDSEIHVADDNWRLLEVYKGEWTAPLTRYVDGAGIDEHLMIERDANGDGDFEDGDRWYFLTDDLGSTARLVKQVEGPISPTPAVNYDPYGLPQIAVDQEMPLFAGMAWDPETGLYYCRNRFYHPQLGRFLSPDPKVAPQGAPSPQGDAQRRLARLNPASSLYAYPAGRPGYFTDPLGLDEDCGCKGGNAGATSPNAAGGGSDGGTTSSDDDDNPNVVETTANIIQKILEWEPLPRFPGTSDPALNLLNVRAVPSYEPTNFERETNKLLQEMVNFKWQSILDRAQKGDLTAAEALALMFDAASNADAKTTVKQLLEWLDRGKPGDGRWSEKSWFGLPWPKNAKGDVIRDSDGIPVPTAGDSGFLPQFQDSWKWPSSSNQSAHFLTAVEVDLLYPWYYPMLVREWAKYGHEMEADFSGRSRFYQACLGMGAWYGQWGAVFTEFGPPYFFEDIDSWKWNSIGSGRGNSYADVLLTMQGSDLADMIKNGEIKTSKQIADWIRKHLSDGTTKP